MPTTTTDDYLEAAYSDALTCVASGEERDWTRAQLIDAFPSLAPDAISDVCADAYRDALKQGVLREDIDPSWYAS